MWKEMLVDGVKRGGYDLARRGNEATQNWALTTVTVDWMRSLLDTLWTSIWTQIIVVALVVLPLLSFSLSVWFAACGRPIEHERGEA